MHDVPYVKAPFIGPEIISAVTRICSDIRRNLPSTIPCGLQVAILHDCLVCINFTNVFFNVLKVLAGGNKEALAIAYSSGLDFIRCEGFVFGHVADEGYMDSCAGSLMRYRKNLEAENIQIYCDIKKKHRYC